MASAMERKEKEGLRVGVVNAISNMLCDRAGVTSDVEVMGAVELLELKDKNCLMETLVDQGVNKSLMANLESGVCIARFGEA